MKYLQRTIRQLLRKAGYDVTRYRPDCRGRYPMEDMKFFLNGQNSPLILDVGAKTGQSVDSFTKAFPDAHLHSFEPSPTTYQRLRKHCSALQRVTMWNCGVGSRPGTLPFIENSSSTMSSFLAPSAFSWGKIERTTEVEVVTLDSFASNQGIEFVHVLKSDTQGYDLEVFKGATDLMKANKIALVYFEIILSDMYKGLPSFDDVIRFLLQHNFSLVTFYESHFQKNLVSWTDALFINREFYQRRVH